MIKNGAKLLFIYCYINTEYIYVSPTDYVIYEMTNKTVSLLMYDS